jgi:5-formaminoimidazole-4-carboxamide-1-beta-D-ribofuranosyl 5'-monophosphate synthetase
MQFKYYIFDIIEGIVSGTNDDETACDVSDFMWVVDASTGEFLDKDIRQPVEEFK